MKFELIKSYAKINLSLHILGKAKSGMHKIESLITFLNLYDEIYIKKIKGKNHKIYFFGKFCKKISKINTVSNLFNILDEKKLLGNQKFLIKIKKKIPLKSGMGGGSMNAASLIKFFLNKKIIYLSNSKIINIANQIGSDVKLGLHHKNTFMLHNEKLLRFKKRLNLFCLVIKPNFGCSTRNIYKNAKSYASSKMKLNRRNIMNINNIIKLNNDLENVVFSKYPKLRALNLKMQKLPNVIMVRMTGSGSALIAYFKSKNASINAAKILKKNYKNYWCIVSKTI
tara:strand:+ start:4519 stop:5367 length:849 start_codon:yes stop_codon:yes gene_type:complete